MDGSSVLDIVLSANVDFVVCTSQLFSSFSFIPSFLQNYIICRKEYNFWEGINSNLFFLLLPSREISSSILPRNKCSNSHKGMHNVARNQGYINQVCSNPQFGVTNQSVNFIFQVISKLKYS